MLFERYENVSLCELLEEVDCLNYFRAHIAMNGVIILKRRCVCSVVETWDGDETR